MNYRFVHRGRWKGNIEIIPSNQSREHVKKILWEIANESYRTADVVGAGRLALKVEGKRISRAYDDSEENLDWNKYLDPEGLENDPDLGHKLYQDPRDFQHVLNMDYVNGRQCKTLIERVVKSNKIRYFFRTDIFKERAYDPQDFLERVKRRFE